MSNRLPILAAEIRRSHETSRTAATKSLQAAIQAGERLNEAKALVKHGEWLPWLREHCGISERTARVYMRLARHKDVVDVKNGSVADLSIRAAVAEITEPKVPGQLVLGWRIKIGVREIAAGWDEVWIAPSFQYEGFYFVTHIWNPRDANGNTSMTGTRRPIRADMVEAMVQASMSVSSDELDWIEQPFEPWTYNRLLFDGPGEYVSSVTDVGELADLANGKEPPADYAMNARPMYSTLPPAGPFYRLAFGDGAEVGR